MKMRDGFSGVGAVVNNEAVAGFSQAQLFRHFAGFEKNMSQKILIVRGGVLDSQDVFLGNQKDMHGGFGSNVTKRQHQVVFKNDVGGDFFCDDFLEYVHFTG